MPAKEPKFPMKFKTFIRWIVPKPRQHVLRLEIFKRYIIYEFTSLFRLKQIAERTPLAERESPELLAKNECEEMISRLTREGVSGPSDGVDFFGWKAYIVKWRSARRIEQRKEARAAGVLKEKRRKFLRVLLNRISAISSGKSAISSFKIQPKVLFRQRKSDRSSVQK
jgi:hypothetical protein